MAATLPGLTQALGAMKRLFREHLGPIATAAIRSEPNAWWQLKREAFDFGKLDWYPMLGYYESLARKGVKNLAPLPRLLLRSQLIVERRSEITDTELDTICISIILMEIKSRAESAAFRTIDW